MLDVKKIVKFLPAVEKPTYKPSLNKKLMWTGLVLVIYYLLSSQLFGHVYGVTPGAGQQFQTLQILLGSTFGTLMTLGIGPIVTASIILQLLVGSKILDWDMSDPDQREKYEATQKVASVSLCFIEAAAFVLGGAVPPKSPDLFTKSIVIVQLAMGGLIVLFLDEIVSKWGIGSGISLFIAAGVVNTIFIRLFTPFTMTGDLPSLGNPPAGIFWRFVNGLLSFNQYEVFMNLIPMISTVVVFLMVIYAQGISLDVPLTFSALRGFGRRWSLKLFYTSNIPVILTAALLANFQLFSGMMAKPLPDDPNTRCSLLGCIFQRPGGGSEPISGVIYYLSAPTGFIMELFSGVSSKLILRALIYMTFMISCCTIFSVFWVNTSGMDAESVADQISSIGMQIPGYRSNPRIIKDVLNRYIPVLTVLGGAAIGFLATFADFTDALGTGTGILLLVTIIYSFYEQLKTERMEGAHPIVRKIMGEE
ncbi:MAG: preprotein translocase subunit SecY [Candidatus Aenigmarchaeota archaeon]|nr:preprotein translocase subunit SecY [Candidatus Aenigmarchaeota archaeon]